MQFWATGLHALQTDDRGQTQGWPTGGRVRDYRGLDRDSCVRVSVRIQADTPIQKAAATFCLFAFSLLHNNVIGDP
jgi:hypothetical protein